MVSCRSLRSLRCGSSRGLGLGLGPNGSSYVPRALRRDGIDRTGVTSLLVHGLTTEFISELQSAPWYTPPHVGAQIATLQLERVQKGAVLGSSDNMQPGHPMSSQYLPVNRKTVRHEDNSEKPYTKRHKAPQSVTESDENPCTKRHKAHFQLIKNSSIYFYTKSTALCRFVQGFSSLSVALCGALCRFV